MSSESEHASSKITYRRLLSYTFKSKGVFIGSVISMVLVALTQPAFAYLMKPMLDGGFIDKDPDVMMWVPMAVIFVFIVRTIGGFASDYGMAWIGRTVIQSIREEMFQKILLLPNTYFDNTSTGETISRFTFDVEQLAIASTTAITVLIKDSLILVSLLGWMVYISPKLSLVFLVIAPVLAIIIVVISKRFKSISKHIQKSMGSITHVLEESVQAQRVVKIFGGQAYETDRFKSINDTNRQQNLKLTVTSSLSTSTLMIIVGVALAGIIFMAIQEGVNSGMTAGTFMAFMSAMLMLFAPMKRLANVNAVIQKGVAAAESVFAFIDNENESDVGNYESENIKGELIFKDLNFSYTSDTDKNILKNINLHIKPGETVAFVGRSGSGKSTLVNLIPRLYDGYQGDILLDGVGLNQYKVFNLRQHIAYVGQEVVLFNDTIEHNISYGDADISL